MVLLTGNVHAQTIDAYLRKIRNNTAALTAFFSQMPKGGDLHHHLDGSVYAEHYFDNAERENLFIQPQTLVVRRDTPVPFTGWTTFRELAAKGQLSKYRQLLLQKWSVKDFYRASGPPDQHFFGTFGDFSKPSENMRLANMLDIKQRAIAQNVSYIESMMERVHCNISVDSPEKFNEQLISAGAQHDSAAVKRLLDDMYQQLRQKNITASVDAYNDSIARWHQQLHIDDASFTMRYMTYALRIMQPATVFREVLSSFEAAEKSPLVVGVNIVAPEDDPVSLRDYWLHMQMFRYCHQLYPHVRYSLHAGELAQGMVAPENLNWHIREAVYTAGAQRIGHGADMAYEQDVYNLLRYMRDHQVAIEINLVSNAFILQLQGYRHPFTLYRDFKVPIVISTDDEGILRTDMTAQYVMLAQHYPELSYAEIKSFVYNGLKYSFIKEPALKQRLLADLDKRFYLFEKNIQLIINNK